MKHEPTTRFLAIDRGFEFLADMFTASEGKVRRRANRSAASLKAV